MRMFTQFRLLSEEEAREMLRTMPKTADTQGDRLAALRVVEFWETERMSPEERAAKAARRSRVLPRTPASPPSRR